MMESTRRFLESKLRLQINEEKSSVTSPDNVHFLGFRFSIGDGNHVKVKLSAKTTTERQSSRADTAYLGAIVERLLRRTKRILPRLDGTLPDPYRGRRV